MKSQNLDHRAFRSIPGAARPNPASGPASKTPVAAAVQGLRSALQPGFPGQAPRIGHRLNWFIGLYLVSLFSFGGLMSALRWTLELL